MNSEIFQNDCTIKYLSIDFQQPTKSVIKKIFSTKNRIFGGSQDTSLNETKLIQFDEIETYLNISASPATFETSFTEPKPYRLIPH